MVKKRIKKWIALVLAAAMTVASAAPQTMRDVYASDQDPGNPFGQNVALGKSVTVRDANGNVDENPGDVTKLVNGAEESTGVFEKAYEYEDGSYKLELVVDLEKNYNIDSVNVAWRNAAAAKEYQILTSVDGENWKSASLESMPDNLGDGEGVTSRKSNFREREARYVKIFCTKERAYHVFSISEIYVYTVGTVEEEQSPNYALGKPAYASVNNQTAQGLTDGTDTRWETGNGVLDKPGAPESVYCYVDLGEIKEINKVNVNFTAAYAKKSKISTAQSEDAILQNNINNSALWEDWATVTSDDGQPTHDIELTSENAIEARYVKITMSEPYNANWGFEVKELEAIHNRESLQVEKLYLSRTEEYAFGNIGATLQLYAQKLPMNASDVLQWTTNAPNVATVSNDGKVTATGVGTATITASAGGKSASVDVTYAETMKDTPKVTTEVVDEDGKKAIKVSWMPKYDESEGVKYILRRRRDEGHLEFVKDAPSRYAENEYIDKDVRPGSQYHYEVKAYKINDSGAITHASEWGKAEAMIELDLESLELAPSTATLAIQNGKAESVALQAIKTPANATETLEWKSEDDTIATVDAKGNVTAVKAGVTQITAMGTRSSISASCKVTVQQQLATPTVTAVKSDDYAVELNWDKVPDAENYEIYCAEGKDSRAGDFKPLTIKEGDIKVNGEKVSYTHSINPDEKMGNYYSYKVRALPQADSNYLAGEMSEATEKIVIGQLSPFATNVALGKKVEVSSVPEQAERLTDGERREGEDTQECCWESARGPSNQDQPVEQEIEQSCIVDLGNIYNINRVSIYWRPLTKGTEYKVSVKEEGNTDYTEIPANSMQVLEGGNLTECKFSYKRARYVKIEVTKSKNYGVCGIREIEVYTPGTVEMEDPTLLRVLLSQRTARMSVGDRLDLYAQKLPANAEEEISWTAVKGLVDEPSSDDSAENELVTLKTFGNDCKVKAVAAGLVTVWAHAHAPGEIGNTQDEHHRNCKILIRDKLKKAENVKAELTEDEQSVAISWDSVENAKEYVLYRAEGKAAKEKDAKEYKKGLTETKFTDSEGLVKGKYYSYWVVAVNDDTIDIENTKETLYDDSDLSAADNNPLYMPIHVEQISLDAQEKTLTILPGAKKPSVKLTATNTPKESEYGFNWEVNPKNIVTVDDGGLVTALEPGEAMVTVTTKDSKSAAEPKQCKITVVEMLATPKVTVEPAEDEKSITVSVEEVANAASYKLERSVGNGEYEEVGNANLTPGQPYRDTDVEPGKTYKYKVTALPAEDSYYRESESAESEYRIPSRIMKITLDKDVYQVGTGEQLKLEAKIEPETVDDNLKALNWQVSTGTCVDIDTDGLITAKGVGEVEITVSAKDEKSSAEPATCKIQVRKRLAKPEVTTVLSADKSSVTVSWNAVDHADSYELWKAVDEGEGEKLNVNLQSAENGRFVCTDSVEKGHIYTYKVVAKPGTDEYLKNEGSANPVKVKKDLAAPANVKAVVAGQNVTLTWAAVEHASGYLVQKSTDGKKFSNQPVIPGAKYEDKNLAPGTYYYRVIAKGNDDYDDSKESALATAEITQNKQDKVKVDKVKITGMSKKIAAGKKIALKAEVTPKNAENKKVKWTTSNKKYATVNAKGVVTTKKAGAGKKVTITATAQDGSGKKGTYKITIMKKAVSKIKLKAKAKTVKAGKKLTIKAVVTPSKNVNKTLSWKSSKTKYATVNSKGVVTAKKAGKGKKVTITATATDGSGKKAVFKIKIQ